MQASVSDLERLAPTLWREDRAYPTHEAPEPSAAYGPRQRPSFAMAPALTSAELAALEGGLGVALPDDYRGFLTTVGPAGPGPMGGLTGPAEWAVPARVDAPHDAPTVDSLSQAGWPSPSPARPFPLTQLWRPGEPVDLPGRTHLYDGLVRLSSLRSLYTVYLVVSGPQRGMVWYRYAYSNTGPFAPMAPFLDWYERWLDGCVTGMARTALTEALDAGTPSPYGVELARWAGSVRRFAGRGTVRGLADLAASLLYQGRDEPAARSEALAIIDPFGDAPRVRPTVEQLSAWADPVGSRTAAADPPRPEAADSPLWRVRRVVAGNERAEPELIARLATDERVEVRLAALANPRCPAPVLASAAADAEARWSADTRVARLCELDLVARQPVTDSSTVASLAALPARLADELASNVVRAVAHRTDLPADLFADLAASAWPWVRAAVAGKPAATPELLSTLAGDDHWAVRREVARRVSAPAEALERLATDSASQVHGWVAQNAATPAGALRRIVLRPFRDGDHYALASVAANPAVPDDVLAAIRQHPRVTASPSARPSTGGNARQEPTLVQVIASYDAASPSYPHALLIEAGAEFDLDIQRYPWIDAALVRHLVRHGTPAARRELLDEQPALPVDVVLDLTTDEDRSVRRLACARPELPVEEAVRLAESGDVPTLTGVAANRSLPPDWLRRLAAHNSTEVRRSVMLNPATPLDVVVGLLVDDDARIRELAGYRDDLSDEMVAALLSDEVRAVAQAGRWFAARKALRPPSDRIGSGGQAAPPVPRRPESIARTLASSHEHIFVIGHPSDAAYIDQLKGAIATAGMTVVSQLDIPRDAHAGWRIQQQVRVCAALVVVMSPAGAEDKSMAATLAVAGQWGKPRLPLLLAGTPFWFVGNDRLPVEDVSDRGLPTGAFFERLRQRYDAAQVVAPDAPRPSTGDFVVVWGGGTWGEAAVPARLVDVIALSAGSLHNLALSRDGRVTAWGANDGGRATVPDELTAVTAIAAGWGHSVALRSNGTVTGWPFRSASRPPSSLAGVTAIAAGDGHSLALRSDGTVTAWGPGVKHSPPSGLADVIAIAAGRHHCVALRSDATVTGWGPYAQPPDGLRDVVAVAAGAERSFAIHRGGRLTGWGRAIGGLAIPPPGLPPVVAVAVGLQHNVALGADGTVTAWGDNHSGQTNVPADLSGVIAIAAGGQRSLALVRA